MDKRLESSVEVWEYLISNGGLDIKKYDTEIIKDLRKNLNLPTQGNLEEQLKRRNVSIEDFIIGFFKTVQPFSEMMSDLLYLFGRVGAKRGSKNMLIKFNFNKKFEGVEFDVSNFKVLEEKARTLIKKYCKLSVPDSSFWGLVDVFRVDRDFMENTRLKEEIVLEWVRIYEERLWPEFDIYSPICGYEDLDAKIKEAWDIWNDFVSTCRNYSSSRNKLYEDFIGRNDDNILTSYAIIDTDYWAKAFIENLYYTIQKIHLLESEEKDTFIYSLGKKLDNILKIINYKNYEVEEAIKEFEEFLTLPVWKHRYELYSAWIFAQIENSLKDIGVEVHSKNGIIEFPFSGAHIASCNSYNPQLQIWTELRTKMDNPIGKGRKGGIQPDYSLAIAPADRIESSALVVECKQYFRASSSNFSKALQDYANGRPNAIVILVNYGEAKQRILERVDQSVRNRTIIIGNMKPGNIKSIDEFKKQVKIAIKRFYSRSKIDVISDKISVPGKIKLVWEEAPRDLDLSLKIVQTDNKFPDLYTIDFRDKGSKDSFPNVKFVEDIMDGYGPEIIEIFEWIKGIYYIRVYNFSNEREIAGCDAKVVLKFGDIEKIFYCPEKGQGDCWEVATIDIENGIIEATNKIIQSM